jgi:hypothetical protein
MSETGTRSAGGQARRQRREPGGREYRVEVKMSAREKEQIERRAARLGLSVPRMLVESVLSGAGAAVAERHALYRELYAVHHLLTGVAGKLNLLADESAAPGRAVAKENTAAAQAAARVLGRLDTLLAAMPSPPHRSRRAASEKRDPR